MDGASGGWRISGTARAPRGCSIEVRVYAEDPFKDFQPAQER